jgi:hypothetical protein
MAYEESIRIFRIIKKIRGYGTWPALFRPMLSLFRQRPVLLMVFVAGYYASYSQSPKTLFRSYVIKEVPQNKYEEILITKDRQVLVSASEASFALITGGNLGAFIMGLDNQDYGIKNLMSVFTGAPIKTITESSEGIRFFSTAGNQITYFSNLDSGICDIPPFYFPARGEGQKEITKLWFDHEDNLYIGVTNGGCYRVSGAGKKQVLDTSRYKIKGNQDGQMVILKGELPVNKIAVGHGTGVYAFAENRTNKHIIWLGAGDGLYSFNVVTGAVIKVAPPGENVTITHIEALNTGDIWYSTLEKGMGVFHQLSSTHQFFPYPTAPGKKATATPINDFCIKSATDFFVAVKDSLPAIFNTSTGSYQFINDPQFALSKNNTTDIKLDSTGNFYFIKGGLLYSGNVSDNPAWNNGTAGNITYAPLIYGVTDFNKREITNFLTRPALLKKLTLPYDQNSLIIYITSNYFSANKKSKFAWTLDGDLKSWVELPAYNSDNDSSNQVELPDLKPGKYIFRVKVKVGDQDWSPQQANMEIIITPPFWKSWWFWTAIVSGLALLIYIIVRLRVRAVRKAEQQKAKYEKDLLELEAKALRAQMNPHFVFNCLNSIKALMQEQNTEKGVLYLTTFSKLIRTLFNNADKKEISLYDEIETCKYYLQLEEMRFDTKFQYEVKIDEQVDLKSVKIPALIVQPFIENAIWHGIVPKNGDGRLLLSVGRVNGVIEILIDDNGIGRDRSQQHKYATGSDHQSKGVNLTQSRLELNNLLHQRQATVKIIDKKDEQGHATGTAVILSISEES